jgi:DNA-binding GntR family transcriptional regulator
MRATPVREPLSELQAESFVLNWPHRGSFVADFSPNETAALYDLRTVLEGHAMAVAAKWLTGENLSNLEDLQEHLTPGFRNSDLDLAMVLNEE